MPSDTVIPKISRSLEKTISLKSIFDKEYAFLGMYDKFYCFKKKTDTKEYDFFFAAFSKKTNQFQIIAQVDLIKKDAKYKVDYVYVHADHRGKNLATKLYQFLIVNHGMTIVSGSTQSPGGKHVWRQLSKCKDVDIRISTPSERKTNDRFINGKYPEGIEIADVVFIASKLIQKKMVRYA